MWWKTWSGHCLWAQTIEQGTGYAEVKILAPEVKKSRTEESKETNLFLIGTATFSKSTTNYAGNSI